MPDERIIGNLNIQGPDVLLDSPARRKPGGPRLRRALVHNQNDRLTVNFSRDYPDGVTIHGALKVAELNIQGPDVLLDSPARRKPGGPRLRRALVHNQNDGLTVNFSGDYPDGVTIHGALKVAEIIPQQQPLAVRGRISYVTPAVPAVIIDGPGGIPIIIKPGKLASTVFVDER